MSSSRSVVVDWLRAEFAAEERAGFPRLSRIPDTRVVKFLDHYASLPSDQKQELAAILADWSSYKFISEPLPQSTYERFAQATAYPNRVEGIRYSNVKLLAGLAKDYGSRGLAGWFQSRGVGRLALKPPDNLLPSIAELVPIRIPKLRKLVHAAMADAFSPVATDIGSGFWRYDGKMSGTPIRLQIRFCGKMITPQLRYDVSVYSPGCTISAPSVCFESVLGVGYGTWDYLTEENAPRSIALLCELLEYVAGLPERMPA
ncbi:MAG TPA: hypothetical protein VGJ05_19090 [Fimbriiglobus sp.]